MSRIEKKIAWTTKGGKPARITIQLETSKEVEADGDMCEVPCCELQIEAEVAGLPQIGPIARRSVTVAGDTYPATIGKLVIPAAQLAQVDTALSEIYATPEWQAKLAAEAADAAAEWKYAEHATAMRRHMAE